MYMFLSIEMEEVEDEISLDTYYLSLLLQVEENKPITSILCLTLS